MAGFGTLDLVARFKAKPGREGALVDALKILVEQTLREGGCERFELYQQADDPGSVVLIERFRDKAAFDTHMESDHVKRFLEVEVPILVAGRSAEFFERIP